MEAAIPLKDFLHEYGESMAEKVTKELTVVHDPAADKEEIIAEIISDMTKKPFLSQQEIIKACCKSLMSGNKAPYTVCEMGTGKTLMAIGVAHVLHKLLGNRNWSQLKGTHAVAKVDDRFVSIAVVEFALAG